MLRERLDQLDNLPDDLSVMDYTVHGVTPTKDAENAAKIAAWSDRCDQGWKRVQQRKNKS
jgi:uncharacterized protein HemX